MFTLIFEASDVGVSNSIKSIFWDNYNNFIIWIRSKPAAHKIDCIQSYDKPCALASKTIKLPPENISTHYAANSPYPVSEKKFYES